MINPLHVSIIFSLAGIDPPGVPVKPFIENGLTRRAYTFLELPIYLRHLLQVWQIHKWRKQAKTAIRSGVLRRPGRYCCIRALAISQEIIRPKPRGRKNETALESAKHLPVTIDGTSGSCTPTPRKIKLNTLDDLRREIAHVYRDARAGTVDVSEAARLTYILTGIGKFIEARDLEKRLAQMERELLK